MSKKILYVITPDLPLGLYKKKLKAILPLGIDYLQYRRKGIAPMEAENELKQLKMLCDLYQVPLIVNDSPELAEKVDAFGVHLGQDDYLNFVPSKHGFAFGRTAKTVEQAVEAEKQGALYIGVGAFFPSSTKNGALPMSMSTLKAIRQAVSLPIYAIGGIVPQKLSTELLAHVDGVCCSAALFASDSPEDAVFQFKNTFNLTF